MKKILLIITVLVTITSICYCQEGPLNLIVLSDKKVYKNNEDIKIKLKITNISQFPIIINSRCESFEIEIKNRNGDVIIPKKSIMLKKGPPTEKDFIKLNSSESWNSDFITISPYKEGGSGYVYLDGCYDILDVGEYTIKARYSNHYLESYNYETGERKKVEAWTGALTSNTISIDVTKKK